MLSGFQSRASYFQSRPWRRARNACRACRAPRRPGARPKSAMNDSHSFDRRPAFRRRPRLVRDAAAADHRRDGGARARVRGRWRRSSAGTISARTLGANRRERRAGRRRADGYAARAPVREDGRAFFRRLRRLSGRIRLTNSRRRQRPALLGGRRFGDRPSVEPACADRAHEYAARAHDQDMVWRRRGSDADAR